MRLDKAISVGIAHTGPTIEQMVIDDGIKEGLDKRAPVFKNAFAVLKKLRGERHKVKADVPAVKNEDGSVRVEAGWTDKNLKARKELDEKIKALSDALDAVSAAQTASEPDGAKIAELYQKLAQTADKASKSVGSGKSNDSESDGA